VLPSSFARANAGFVAGFATKTNRSSTSVWFGCAPFFSPPSKARAIAVTCQISLSVRARTQTFKRHCYRGGDEHRSKKKNSSSAFAFDAPSSQYDQYSERYIYQQNNQSAEKQFLALSFYTTSQHTIAWGKAQGKGIYLGRYMAHTRHSVALGGSNRILF
jgi:hypothetical protein